jgi:hypothetical protein
MHVGRSHPRAAIGLIAGRHDESGSLGHPPLTTMWTWMQMMDKK